MYVSKQLIIDDCKEVCVTSHECLNKYVPVKCPYTTEHLVDSK